jgi:two-component system, OmpR family, response regulator QseB
MKRILIVTRFASDAAGLAKALRRAGFSATVLTSIDEARAELAASRVELVVIDLDAKCAAVLDGLSLARELRTAYPATRVVLASACRLTERQLERTDCGACGFLPKPFECDRAAALIHHCVEKPPRSRRLWHAEGAAA